MDNVLQAAKAIWPQVSSETVVKPVPRYVYDVTFGILDIYDPVIDDDQESPVRYATASLWHSGMAYIAELDILVVKPDDEQIKNMMVEVRQPEAQGESLAVKA